MPSIDDVALPPIWSRLPAARCRSSGSPVVPQYDDLRRQILAKFAGRVATVGEIEEFVLTETAFRETHYRRQILNPYSPDDGAI
jgi:hypothetical protein